MPKRSLNPGNGGKNSAEQKKIEQLNKALDSMLARNDGRPAKAARKPGPTSFMKPASTIRSGS